MAENFHSGFVTIIGKPNVGKSTLMNALIDEKVAITSGKPQTTRNKIQTFLTGDDYQIIFVDTPGIHKPMSKLGDYMLNAVEKALDGVDIVMVLVDATNTINDSFSEILNLAKRHGKILFLIINKTDLITKEKLLQRIDAYKNLFDFTEIIPVSALKGIGKDELIKTVVMHLPQGPKFYPDDIITDQTERSIISEIIREKALYLLQDEIPHGIAVEVTAMKERSSNKLMDVEATIYCERDSHKGIIIGKAGTKLKEIGRTSRIDIERLMDMKINLQLWVKVKKDWRDSDFLLRSFGYDKKML